MVTKTSFWQKIMLVLLSVVLVLAMLEIGLRIGGLVLSSLQEYRNWKTIKQGGQYRIICIGESTTFRQYPAQLNDVLNRSSIGIKFIVIDKGIPGITTTGILQHLENNLDTYTPHMVIAMMGVNDTGSHMPQEYVITSQALPFVASLKTYKLLKFLWLGIVKKFQSLPTLSKPTFPSTPLYSLTHTGQFTNYGLRPIQGTSVESADRVLYVSKAKEASEYIGKGFLLTEAGEFKYAEEAFKQAIKIDPQNSRAYTGLGWVYRQMGQPDRAIDAFKKAIDLDSTNISGYQGLGWMYLTLGDLTSTKEMFGKIIKLDPNNLEVYMILGWLYQREGNVEQAARQLQKAISLNSSSDRLYGQLATIYLQQGKDNLAQQYSLQADRLRSNDFICSVTAKNYLRLKEILDKRKIKLVCVQYPMRSIEPLRHLFTSPSNIIFVDNERIFKEVLRKSNPKEYFIDMFAGDFGHCTKKGNQLLAENIANAIIKNVFHK